MLRPSLASKSGAPPCDILIGSRSLTVETARRANAASALELPSAAWPSFGQTLAATTASVGSPFCDGVKAGGASARRSALPSRGEEGGGGFGYYRQEWKKESEFFPLFFSPPSSSSLLSISPLSL